jgi:hypothetical protein
MIEIRINSEVSCISSRIEIRHVFIPLSGGKSEIIYDIFMISILSHYDTRRLAILTILPYIVYLRIS